MFFFSFKCSSINVLWIHKQTLRWYEIIFWHSKLASQNWFKQFIFHSRSHRIFFEGSPGWKLFPFLHLNFWNWKALGRVFSKHVFFQLSGLGNFNGFCWNLMVWGDFQCFFQDLGRVQFDLSFCNIALHFVRIWWFFKVFYFF